MSTTLLARGPAADRTSLFARFDPTLLALLTALPLTLALSWSQALTIWQTGSFFDTDDAMRAVEVRDWMAGQGWFDLSVHRMGLPPGSLFSHWSRTLDVPLAALIGGFGLILEPAYAERAARIAFPVALQAAMIVAIGYPARLLAGSGAIVPAALVIALGGIGAYQFAPGRIVHHAPEILLLTLMAGTTLDSLERGRASRAALTGLLVALSLATSLENLPFIAIVLAVPPLAWAAWGATMRATLVWLAAGLAVAVPALFVATVGPARYGIVATDAFSLVHLAAALLGAGVLAILAAATPRLVTAKARLAALAVAGGCVGAALASFVPNGLHGPFYGVDPLLHPFWLDHVQEATPLPQFLRDDSGAAVALMAPMVLGALAAALAWRDARGLPRARWSVILALVAMGFAGSVWEIRVASSLQPLALLGAAWAIMRLWDRAKTDGRSWVLILPAAGLTLCSSVAWALVPLPHPAAKADAPSCIAAPAYAPLAALPPGLVFAPLDPGSFLLAHTPHSVLAGAYHRDGAGILAVIRGFMAPSDEAHAMIEATGARYVLDCDGGTDLEQRAAPNGLAAALAAGRVPSWLRPIPLTGTPFRAYAVQ